MSFLKRLFGLSDDETTQKSIAQVDYQDFHIVTLPKKEGGQYRVCANISKEIDGEMKEHRLLRADMCSTQEEASDIALRKAQQLIDEKGVNLFG